MNRNKRVTAVAIALMWMGGFIPHAWGEKQQPTLAEEPRQQEEVWQPLSSKRFVRLIYFWDTRGFSTFKPFYGFPLPGNMHFFGFTSINSSEGASNHFELTEFFTEARLTSPLWHGVGLQTELNASTGANNDLLRVGGLYKRTFRPYYQNWTLIGRVFPVETDGDGGQVSCLYNLQLYKDVLMLDGTVDYNWRNTRDTWVVEPLLSVKLYKNLRLAIEYRLNNGRGSRKSGVAFGLESKFAF